MCTKCERYKLNRWVRKGKDEQSPAPKKRLIDASPKRNRYDLGGPIHSNKSVNAQVSVLSDNPFASGDFEYGMANLKNQAGTTHNSPMKRPANRTVSPGKHSTTSPNLMAFLETTQSKDRLLLTKAYNVNLQNQIEFEEKHSPENRYFRLYVCEKGNQTNRSNNVDPVNCGLAATPIGETPNNRTPRDNRRKTSHLMPSQYGSAYLRPDYTGIGKQAEIKLEGDQLEAEIQRVLALIEKNTAEENYKLYMVNAVARRLFLERADVCDCSEHGRRRLRDGGSMSGSVHSHRGSLKKGRFGEISEMSNEADDDIHALMDRPTATRRRHHHHHNYNAYGQHVPCRRTCSTVHHPIFHALGKGGRPKSADNKKKVQQADWHKNEIAQILDMSKVINQVHTQNRELTMYDHV